MPIVRVHGIAKRDPQRLFREVERYLRLFIAPLLSGSPDDASTEQACWGNVGALLARQGNLPTRRHTTRRSGRGSPQGPTARPRLHMRSPESALYPALECDGLPTV
jgi:hypothetical protein